MSMRRSLLLLVVFMFALNVGTLSVAGQAISTGIVAGTVTDNTGAVVAGAKVTLVDKSTNDTRTTLTNAEGHFVFANVNPGVYNIRYSKSGFSETVIAGATVEIGTTLTENIQMKLGPLSQTITVTESAGAELQTMNSTVGQTISGVALDSMPSIGHDVVTFATMQPGVTPGGSVAGTVSDQSSFTLDGGNNTNDMDGGGQSYTPSFGGDPTGGLIAGTGLHGGNTTGGVPSGVLPTPSDSVEEVKVNTANQTADFNSSSGSQVEIVTRRGTNNVHGSLYEYYLDNNFNANTWDNNLSGTPIPSFHYNFFGARLGGPVIPKDFLGGKTYMFGNYQSFRWPNSATYEQAVPSDAMRLGLLQFGTTVYNLNPYPVTYPSADKAIGVLVPGTTYAGSNLDPRGIGINPVVQTMWNTYEPEPNDFGPTGTPGCGGIAGSRCDSANEIGFKTNVGVPIKDEFGVVRLDHDFGAKWHFNTSYHYYSLVHQTTSQVDIGGVFAGDKLGVATPVSSKPLQPSLFTASLTTNISANVTNDFHYSHLRNYWAWADAGAPPQPGTDSSGVLEPLGESATVLAPYNVNTQSIRTRFWDGIDNDFRDDVTMLHGNHIFQFGGTYEHNWNYHQRTDNGGGINYTLTYQLGDTGGSGLVDLSNAQAAGYPTGVKQSRDYAATLGIVTDSQISYTRQGANLALNPPLTPAFDQSTIPYYNVYFSDSWHLKPSLTVTYGLGWTLEMPPVEAQGKQILLVDSAGQSIDAESYFYQRKQAALAGNSYDPNVGFALVGNTGNHQKYPYNPFYGSFSPRIAVAWNPHFDSGSFMSNVFGENNTVVRGGYGRIYGRLNGVDLVLAPLLGTGLIQPVQCRQALSPITSTGLCGPTNPNETTAFRVGIDGNTAPLAQPAATLPQPDYPGINAVSASTGESLDPNFRPNVVDSFDLTIQRQFGPKWMLELGYIGRRITHEYQPLNINAVPYMMTQGGQTFASAYAAVETALGCATSVVACNTTAYNVSNGFEAVPTVAPQPFFETALAGTGYCTGFSSCTAAVLDPTHGEFGNFTSQAVWNLWSDLDQGGIGGGLNGTTNPGFNFPRTMLNTPIAGGSSQLTSGVAINSSVGYGNYNGVFASLKTNDWHGVTAQQNFTFSKALGTGAVVQASSEYTADDPYNLKTMYGNQGYNQKFIYNLFIVYQPPFFKGQHGIEGHLLGGWNISPIFTAGSGLPLYCNTNTDAQAFGAADGANFFENEQCIFTKPATGGTIHYGVAGGADAQVPCASSGCSGTVPLDLVGTSTAGSVAGQEANIFANPVATWSSIRSPILGIDNRANGNGEFAGPRYWNVDLSVKKNIAVTERFSAELQFLFLNVLNHNQLGGGDTLDMTNPGSWGVQNVQANTPRQFEFGLRFNF